MATHRQTLLYATIVSIVILCAGSLATPITTRADAPATRGTVPIAAGGMSSAASWTDTEPLPPLAVTSPATVLTAGTGRFPSFLGPSGQTDGGGVTGWIDRKLNPGNWLMDAVLGGNTGMLLTMIELSRVLVVPLVEPGSQCVGVVFCTPTDMLFGGDGSMSLGLYSVWSRLEGIAVALASILFIVRIGQMIGEGSQSLRAEGPGLFATLVVAVAFIYGSGSILKWGIDLFNGINDTILQGHDFKILDVFQPTAFNFGLVLIQMLAVVMIIIFVVLGYVRLLKLFILMCFAPIMGVLLLLNATAATFWQWLKAMLSLLLEQTAWSLAFVIGITLAMPAGSMPDPSQNAVTQLQALGIPAIYAHQALTQLGKGGLKDLMLVNAGNRIILQTLEPDASTYAKHYAASGLTATDISAQPPREHQYAVMRCNGQPSGPLSMRPLPWPQPVHVHVAAYVGPSWQAILPPDSADPSFDRGVIELVYRQHDDPAQVAQSIAESYSLTEYTHLLDRWNAIRAVQRQYILDHPGCIPDRLERQRWLSRLLAAQPRILAEVEYLRQRPAIVPASRGATQRGARATAGGNASVAAADGSSVVPSTLVDPPDRQSWATPATPREPMPTLPDPRTPPPDQRFFE